MFLFLSFPLSSFHFFCFLSHLHLFFIIYLFPSLSLLNHDCRPNCVMVFEGTKLFLRAVRDICPHEEVWESTCIDRIERSKWEIHKCIFWHFNITVICRILFYSSNKRIRQTQRTKYNLNPENPHLHSQVKIEAKGISVQHKQDVTPRIGRVLHPFLHFPIHQLTRCNKMHPGHLEEMHTPPPTTHHATLDTPNNWAVFIYNLECNKFSKMILLRKDWQIKGTTFLLSANYKLHWDAVSDGRSTAAAGGSVPFYLPVSALRLSR